MEAKISKEEYEKKVLELAKQGLSSEKIGLELKKQKIQAREHEKISKILKKHNLYVSADISNLKKSIEKLKKHSQKHKQDKTYKRCLSIKSAKLRKLEKSSYSKGH